MTPADHGYRRCEWCGVWRPMAAIDPLIGICLDHAGEDAKPEPAFWVERARDWHTDACLTRQATGEGCNCRPWTEGAP